MALTLSLRTRDKFSVGDTNFVVVTVPSGSLVAIQRLDTKEKFILTDTHSTEVLPDVYMSVDSVFPMRRGRIVFEAPPHVVIKRAKYVKHADNSDPPSEH